MITNQIKFTYCAIIYIQIANVKVKLIKNLFLKKFWKSINSLSI